MKKDDYDNSIDMILTSLILALETEESDEFKRKFIKAVETICEKKINSMMGENYKRPINDLDTINLGEK